MKFDINKILSKGKRIDRAKLQEVIYVLEELDVHPGVKRCTHESDIEQPKRLVDRRAIDLKLSNHA